MEEFVPQYGSSIDHHWSPSFNVSPLRFTIRLSHAGDQSTKAMGRRGGATMLYDFVGSRLGSTHDGSLGRFVLGSMNGIEWMHLPKPQTQFVSDMDLGKLKYISPHSVYILLRVGTGGERSARVLHKKEVIRWESGEITNGAKCHVN